MSRIRVLPLHTLAVVGLIATSCAATTAKANPTPSPSHAATVLQLPDFNTRLGSNRLAAEAAAAMGRKLSGHDQYWEVYVQTVPLRLPGTYDPAHPDRSAPAAGQVTSADVVIATEAGATVRKFSAGGKAGQQAQLAELELALRQAFPAIGTTTFRLYFGEAYQYATAVFEHGTLTRFDVKS